MKDCNYERAVSCLAALFIKAELYANEKADKKKLKQRVLEFVS